MDQLRLQKFSWRGPARLGLTCCIMGAAALLFMRCGTEELGFIDPFELSYADQFPEVVPPTITEAQVTVKTPVAAQVTIPAEVNSTLVELGEATTKAEVEKAMEVVTPATNQFVAQSSPQQVATLAELTNELSTSTLNNLRAGTTTLGADDQALLRAAEAFPAIAQFLPGFIQGSVGSRINFEEQSVGKKLELVAANLRVMDLVGPCREAANDAYQEALDELNQVRTTSQTTINASAATREAAIQTRFVQRNTKALADSDLRWTQIFAIFAIYQDQFDSLDVNQRYYLSLLIYFLVDLDIRAYNFDLQINLLLRQQELAESTAIRTTSTNALTTWYNAEKVKLDDTLAKVLGSCHNQGTGN